MAELYTIQAVDPLTGKGTLTTHSNPVKHIDDNGALQFIDTTVEPKYDCIKAKGGVFLS